MIETGIRILRLMALMLSCVPLLFPALTTNTLAKPSKARVVAAHEQGDETPVFWKRVKTCVFKVDGSEWKDQIGNPNIPDQYQTDQTRLKAKNALLVVNASVVNKGNVAVRTGGVDVLPLVFRLTNEPGQLFAPVEHAAVQQGDLTSKLWIGADVNPGEALSGTMVFDVPKGNYVLVTYNSRFEGNSFQPAKEIFRHKLAPVGGQQSPQ